MIQPRSMVPAGLQILSSGAQLPVLETVEFILTGAGNELDGVTAQLVAELQAPAPT